jgi:FG-GAP repeat
MIGASGSLTDSPGLRVADGFTAARRAWVGAVALVGVVLLVVVGAGVGGRGVLRSGGPSAAGLARLQGLPLQAQSVISTAVGAGAPVFVARRSGDGYRTAGGGVSGRFDPTEAVVGTGAGSLSFRSLAIGRGARVARLGRLSIAAEHGRVVYESRGVSEWYAAGPLGIEQGFTLTHRPAGAERRLTVAIGFAGGLRARLSGSSVRFSTGSGRLALRYGGLSVTDARGRALPATLTVHHGELLIGVSDAGARYPLRIDPLIQQGSKLTPNDETGEGYVGYSVALSADGNTALIGDLRASVAWVFTRSGSTWTQQGSPLTTNPGTGQFGFSVALSADGNTALIGAGENGIGGGAWVFTRSGSTWTQQGSMLSGSGETGFYSAYGASVALSADGNTALISDPADGVSPENTGAVWVFTRSGTTWTQQGSKLTASDETGAGGFGDGVALSADGNTALIGGGGDNGTVGAAWVFTRSESTWTQQGSKLTAEDESGAGGFGSSVALSSDDSTALIGGFVDNSGTGAAWVFTRSGTTWTQQGSKLTASDETSDGYFGDSVALSSEGNTALIGGRLDDSQVGAAWVFARSGTTWTQQGSKLTASDETGAAEFGFSVALSSEGGTALIGGYNDNNGRGAAWVFTGSGGDGGSGAGSTGGTAGSTGTSTLGAGPTSATSTTGSSSGSSAPATHAVALGTQLGLPSSKGCLSQRKLTIHVAEHIVQASGAVKIKSAEVLLAGRVVAKLKGSDLVAHVSLMGLEKGSFKVTVKATTTAGRTLTASSTFRTCVRPKRKPSSPHPARR